MSEREKELKKVKKIIKENQNDYDCGIFNTRNLVNDTMLTIFKGKYFTLDCCYNYSYFELFGTTDEEFEKIEKEYYKNCRWNHE